MNKKIVSFVAAVFISTLPMSVLANTVDEKQVDVSVTLNPGQLTYEVDVGTDNKEINFGELNLEELSEKGEITATSGFKKIIINDARGTGEGYTLKVQAEQFARDLDGKSIKLDPGVLTLQVPSVAENLTDGKTSDIDIQNISNTTIDEGGVALAVAKEGTGFGRNQITFDTDSLKLNIKQRDAKLGSYKSVVTFTLSSGPNK